MSGSEVGVGLADVHAAPVPGVPQAGIGRTAAGTAAVLLVWVLVGCLRRRPCPLASAPL